MIRFFGFFVLVGAIVLGACAPRGPLSLVLDRPLDSVTRRVFVATSREQSSTFNFGVVRSEAERYLAYDIHVPPDRAPGTMEISSGPPNPETDFGISSAAAFPDLASMIRRIATELASRPRGQREVTLYVHGFNNTFTEGMLRVAQLSHDLDLEAIGIHYSWPSGANPLGYGYDRDSMLFARDGLERLIRAVGKLGAERVIVVAHSMGALLTMESLRQIAIVSPGLPPKLIDSVVLISPDIDIDVFRAQARRIGTLPQPFVLFVSQRDRALALSARLTGQRQRLGNIADPERLAEFDVTVLDVTDFSSGLGHFTPGTSPALLAFLGRLSEVDAAFQRDRSGRTGLIPGTVLTVQNATEVILSPSSIGAGR